jgi:hypothetical protein
MKDRFAFAGETVAFEGINLPEFLGIAKPLRVGISTPSSRMGSNLCESWPEREPHPQNVGLLRDARFFAKAFEKGLLKGSILIVIFQNGNLEVHKCVVIL